MSETLIDDPPAPGSGGERPEPPDAEVADDAASRDGSGGLLRRTARRLGDRVKAMPIEGWITLGVLVSCVAFVFYQLNWGDAPHSQIGNLLTNNTPAGGDMGAHVWAPAFMRDHLLPSGRLSGWTPDWYAGFPAFTFYMILPSLAIALLSYVIPYGIAFKLVAVSGVLSLPVAAWAFGRLNRMPFPIPPMLAVGATAYLFDRSFSIYGGNIASTLAGEFAFSISLTFALLFLGVLARGLETGRYRALAAALLALTALCHVIPLFFAIAGTLVLFALQLDWSRVRWYAWLSMVAGALALGTFGSQWIIPTGQLHWPVAAPTTIYFLLGVLGAAVVLFFMQRPWGQFRYLATVLPVGGLISAFWTFPFVMRRQYSTDMGWEKLTNYSNYLFSRAHLDQQLSDKPGIQYLLILAAVGALMSLAYRRRGGVFWVAMTAVAALAFLYDPQGRFWNARTLPFYYLALYLLGAIAIADVGRTIAKIIAADVHRPPRVALWLTAGVGFAVWLIVLALPLRSLPFGQVTANGSTYRWGPLSTKDDSFVTSWASWNFTGYEGKSYYPEYYAVVKKMGEVGQQHGCGRAMWEYSGELNNYGTPMALMLLPMFTDGCIGSMEGLYFEASATTPYHFLNQAELSTNPSEAERGLPYRTTALTQSDFDLGVRHLQMLGVRYYMASTAQATGLAQANKSLHEVATSGPWTVFQVEDSALVTPLTNLPAVVNGASAGGKTWLDDTVDWYDDPSQWSVPLAASGPPSWQRIDENQTPGKRPAGTTKVSNIHSGTDTISFDVSKVGVPVVVKTSYFPNWQVSGGDGPYRISPNLMVVVPHSTHVSLHYGYTTVDYTGFLLTLVGLIGFVALWRAKPVEVAPIARMWLPEEERDAPPPVVDPRDPDWWVDPDDPLATGPPPPPGEVPVVHERVPASQIDPEALILGTGTPPDPPSPAEPPG